MKCPKCGAEQREGAKFCFECGSKLENNPCPQCGNTNPAGGKFCDECGYDLRKPKEAKSLDLNHPRSYTPKHLADKILTSRGSMDGEHKTVTVMFADVANSTAMFEKLYPEDVHGIMDGCLRLVLDEVHRYEGTINQFPGDGVMAIFGAPIAHEDHAQRACHAALAVRKALAPYAESVKNCTNNTKGLRYEKKLCQAHIPCRHSVNRNIGSDEGGPGQVLHLHYAGRSERRRQHVCQWHQ